MPCLSFPSSVQGFRNQKLPRRHGVTAVIDENYGGLLPQGGAGYRHRELMAVGKSVLHPAPPRLPAAGAIPWGSSHFHRWGGALSLCPQLCFLPRGVSGFLRALGSPGALSLSLGRPCFYQCLVRGHVAALKREAGGTVAVA